MPSKTLLTALAADALTGTILTWVGLKDLVPLPGWQMLVILGYALVVCLGVNDAVKVSLIRLLIPEAAAERL
jgi:H+-transporting ATPase